MSKPHLAHSVHREPYSPLKYLPESGADYRPPSSNSFWSDGDILNRSSSVTSVDVPIPSHYSPNTFAVDPALSYVTPEKSRTHARYSLDSLKDTSGDGRPGGSVTFLQSVGVRYLSPDDPNSIVRDKLSPALTSVSQDGDHTSYPYSSLPSDYPCKDTTPSLDLSTISNVPSEAPCSHLRHSLDRHIGNNLDHPSAKGYSVPLPSKVNHMGDMADPLRFKRSDYPMINHEQEELENDVCCPMTLPDGKAPKCRRTNHAINSNARYKDARVQKNSASSESRNYVSSDLITEVEPLDLPETNIGRPIYPENHLARPEFNSTLKVSQEIKALKNKNFDIVKEVEEKLKVNRVKEKIAEKAACHLNPTGAIYAGLVQLDVDEARLLSAAQRNKPKPVIKQRSTKSGRSHYCKHNSHF